MEEFGYLKRTREPTDKGTFRHEQVVCDDPELLQGEPPAPENPAPENPPESGPPGTGNQAPVNQALKDKDGNHKENPSGSAAPGGSMPTVSQRAMKVAKGFCDKYPLHSFHDVRSMATRAIQAGGAGVSDVPDYVRGHGLQRPRRPQSTTSAGRAPCPWAECRCTHEPPCVAGWIDTDEREPERGADGRPRTRDGQPVTHQTTRPCPNCRPEAAQALADPMLTRGQQFSKILKRKER